MEIDRRRLALGVGGFLAWPTLLSAAVPAHAAAASTKTWLRLVADLSGEPVFAVTRGDVWGFKPQADDLTTDQFAKRLYGYWSFLARQARVRPDGSVALTTKAWSFYLDPDTGEVAGHLLNPYQGTTVACPPLSGPVSTLVYKSPPGAEQNAASPVVLTERRMADRAWIGVNRISRFKPKDTSWYKLEADLTSYACRSSDLDDPSQSRIANTWSHNLVAEWQTWMHMHGEPGHILFKGDGAQLPGPDLAPPELLAAIDSHFPGTAAPVFAWRR